MAGERYGGMRYQTSLPLFTIDSHLIGYQALLLRVYVATTTVAHRMLGTACQSRRY